MDYNDQIEAYLEKDRDLKYQEKFLISKIYPFLEKNNKYLEVLDLACGDGLLIRSLSNKFPSHQFHGFDLSHQLIDIANSRGKIINLNYFVKDCREINNEKFDVIIASGILSIFEDWEFILKRWLDLLDNEGVLFVFGGFNPFNIDVKIKFRNNYKNNEWQSGLDLISIETFKSFCEANRLDLENLGEFRPPFNIPKSENPIRGFTIKDEDGTNLVINGALQVRRFFYLN